MPSTIPPPPLQPDELCFEEFADALVRVALVAYSRPPLSAQLQTPHQKVMALLSHMDLNSRGGRVSHSKPHIHRQVGRFLL